MLIQLRSYFNTAVNGGQLHFQTKEAAEQFFRKVTEKVATDWGAVSQKAFEQGPLVLGGLAAGGAALGNPQNTPTQRAARGAATGVGALAGGGVGALAGNWLGGGMVDALPGKASPKKQAISALLGLLGGSALGGSLGYTASRPKTAAEAIPSPQEAQAVGETLTPQDLESFQKILALLYNMYSQYQMQGGAGGPGAAMASGAAAQGMMGGGGMGQPQGMMPPGAPGMMPPGGMPGMMPPGGMPGMM